MWSLASISYYIYQCLRVIYLQRKGLTGTPEQISAIRELIVSEHVETVMPITYFVCFLSDFYGPNAEVLGGVKFDGWHFKAVNNIDKFCTNLLFFFFIDMCSLVFSTIALWTCCKINLVRAYYQILRELWIIMAVQTSFSMLMVSINSKY